MEQLKEKPTPENPLSLREKVHLIVMAHFWEQGIIETLGDYVDNYHQLFEIALSGDVTMAPNLNSVDFWIQKRQEFETVSGEFDTREL